MKIIAFILTVYILLLIAIPCVDVPPSAMMHKIEHSQNTTDNHQHNTDHCSPFCTCYCCTTPILYQTFTLQFSCFSLSQKFESEYRSAYISTLFTSIWQPPKLI